MKKLLPGLVLLSLLFLCSCSKEHSNSPTAKKYKITYNLSGFTQQILNSAGKKQITSLQTNSNGFSSSADVLYYFVYNASQARVGAIYQDSTYANFGSITDSLSAGTYTVIFAAGKSGLTLNPDTRTLTSGYAGYSPSLIWQDTFYQELTLTVASGDINQNINLSRIISELTINIQDQIPATASKIALTVGTDYGYFYLSNEAPYQAISPRTTTYTLPASVLGTSNYTRSIMMFNSVTPFTATIVCYNSANQPLGQATVNNITLQPNTQTILSGSLFGATTGFTTTLNHAWDPTTINYPF